MGIPVERIVKLASNENPLGMSPKAQICCRKAIGSLERYPDDFELKAALAASHCGSAWSASCWATAGRTMCSTSRAFSRAGAFHGVRAARLCRLSAGDAVRRAANRSTVPGQDFGHDLDAMRAIRPDTRLSGSPTRTIRPAPSCRSAAQKAFCSVPSDVVVVIDEAYNRYIPPAERVDTAAWLSGIPEPRHHADLLQIYGLAGCASVTRWRSAEVADLMNRVRQPFNCNNLAIAGAAAGARRRTGVRGAQPTRSIRAGMEQIVLRTPASRFRCTFPSHGNFPRLQCRRCRGAQSETAQARRHRSSDRRLRHASGCA